MGRGDGQVVCFVGPGSSSFDIVPKPKRICPAGHAFYVPNRAVARWTLFEKLAEFEAFIAVLRETWVLVPITILVMAVMPNQWYFVVDPTTVDSL